VTGEQPMTNLLNAAGRAKLRDVIDSATLFAFDLDGTLAPIVADPDAIKIPADVLKRLTDLNRIAKVAIITGRLQANAREHLGFTPRFLVGNHGAEGLPGCEKLESEFIRLCRDWKKQLLTLLSALDNCGIVLEDKGTTLTLHYRNAIDLERTQLEIIDIIGRLIPSPRRVSGKLVENIVPQQALHKGEALLLIMRHLECSRALYIGDDETDEDVFRLANDSIFGVRVGASAGSAAHYYLRDQGGVGALLDIILAGLQKNHGLKETTRA